MRAALRVYNLNPDTYLRSSSLRSSVARRISSSCALNSFALLCIAACFAPE